jgi:hypothetical protein
MHHFLKILLTINNIMAMTAITIKIPTPIPALNIPPMTSQLFIVKRMVKAINNFVILFCIIIKIYGFMLSKIMLNAF